MPLQPLVVNLSDGQKRVAVKRLLDAYREQLLAIEAELTEALLAQAEADYLAPYLGEQPEVKELRTKGAEAPAKEARRQYLGKLIERLEQVLPSLPDVHVPPPGGQAPKAGGLRKY